MKELLDLKHKLNMELMESVKKGIEDLKTQQEKQRYFEIMWPIVCQQLFC